MEKNKEQEIGAEYLVLNICFSFDVGRLAFNVRRSSSYNHIRNSKCGYPDISAYQVQWVESLDIDPDLDALNLKGKPEYWDKPSDPLINPIPNGDK